MNQQDSQVENAWVRIRKWFEENLPDIDRDQLEWGAPAPEQSLKTLEKAMKTKLPGSFRQTYLLYDGHGPCRIFESGSTLSVAEILQARDIRKQMLQTLKDEFGSATSREVTESIYCDPSIKRRPWSAKWLPFTDSGAGDHLCIDFDPTPQGISGQIIWVDHETGPKNVVAKGFEELVIRQADDLESGKYRYDVDAMQIKKVV